MKSAKTKHLCFARLNPEIEFLQPLWQHLVESFGILLIAEGTDPIIGIPTEDGFAFAMQLDHPVKPQVKGVVEIDIRQNGGDNPALRRSGLRVNHRPIRFQYPSLQPFTYQVQKRRIINAQGQHLQQPLMVDVVKEALNIGFHKIPKRPVLQLKRQVSHRVQGGFSRPDTHN